MVTKTVRLFWVFLLPLLHLFVCITIALLGIGTAWQYMIAVDFPMSVVVIAISYNFDHPLLLFGLLGTLWWYLLTRGAQIIGKILFATIRKRRVGEARSGPRTTH